VESGDCAASCASFLSARDLRVSATFVKESEVGNVNKEVKKLSCEKLFEERMSRSSVLGGKST